MTGCPAMLPSSWSRSSCNPSGDRLRVPQQEDNPFVRRICWLLVLVPLLIACGAKDLGNMSGTGSNGSCVAPYLDHQPPGGHSDAASPTVRPGHSLKIYGHWYTSTCNDTVANGTPANQPLKPLPPVRLTLTLPGGEVQRLGRYRPGGQDLGFTVSVRIPTDARAGTATITDDRTDPATYSFRISGR